MLHKDVKTKSFVLQQIRLWKNQIQKNQIQKYLPKNINY